MSTQQNKQRSVRETPVVDQNLINAAERELGALIYGAAQRLSKAAPPPPPEEDEGGEVPPEAEGSAEAPPEGVEGEGGDAGPGEGDGGGDPVQQATEFLQSQPPEMVMAFYQAARQLLGEGGGQAGMTEESPPAPGGPGMGKSEILSRLDRLEQAVRKSQARPASRNAVTAQDAHARVPQRPLNKREDEPIYLSRSQIGERLTKRAKSPATKSEDRRAINDYYDGKVDIDAIAHLLREGN